MQKDSAGFIGFIFKEGKIKSLVKDSSAARNGVLTDHHLIEVNGQNVVGVKVSWNRNICLHQFCKLSPVYEGYVFVTTNIHDEASVFYDPGSDE